MTRLFKQFIFVALLLPISFASLARSRSAVKLQILLLVIKIVFSTNSVIMKEAGLYCTSIQRMTPQVVLLRPVTLEMQSKELLQASQMSLVLALIVLSLTSVLLIKITSHFHYSLMSPERSLRLTTLLIIL